MIITESSIRSDLHLDDAEGTDCLPTTTIFEELAKLGLSAKSTAWNKFSSSMASLLICLATNLKFNLSKYIFDAMIKHLDREVKFMMYLRFLQVFINQQLGDMSHHKKVYVNPSHTNKIFANMKRAGKDFSERITPLFDTMMVQASGEVGEDSDNPTDSNQIPIVLDLEKAKSDQAIEIASLKKRVDKLENRRKFKITWLKRLKKVGAARRIESSNDSLGAQENASKQERRIEDIDADAEVTLVNETQERQDKGLMFDTGVLDDDEVFVDVTTGEKNEQSTKIDDSTAGEAVTTAGVKDSVVLTIPTTVEEILAQTLMEIKAAKPKAKGIVFYDQEEQVTMPTVSIPQPSIKDKGKDIQAQLDVEIIEEERLERKNQEEANIALIESWENTQAMIEADRLLAERLQTREREELIDEEKGNLFMELMKKRRKHFAALRAQEKRNIPPTKAQKRTQMSTYLKHMEGSEEKAKSSRKKSLGKKRAVKKHQQESPKRQKLKDDKETDEHEEVEADDTTELKKHLVIEKDDDIAIDAIPLATKPPRRFADSLEASKNKACDLRPEDEHERVMWGDFKVMFEPDIISKIQKMNIKFRGGLLKLKRLQGFLLPLSTVSIELLLSVEVKTAQS
ncbi:hypothetical protein Tco_0703596 [Tanacetum coccineum]|uniref:Uncharacterized protein n=1 Tax=Tanacetum coccineum TaxID=301880 RepID=A0ABQ4XZA3_9ASTR